MVVQLLVMSAILGGSTFAVGMLPLSYAFSSMPPSYSLAVRIKLTSYSGSHLERLATLGTGLLLGAALGVIIPE